MNAPEDASPAVAIVGTGQIGAVHVECARRAGATVVGLVGSSPDRARAKATTWGIPVVYSNLEELLEQPEIDAVHIASPNPKHKVTIRTVRDDSVRQDQTNRPQFYPLCLLEYY